MTTEEANKKANEYEQMFIKESWMKFLPYGQVKRVSKKCALKLVDELIRKTILIKSNVDDWDFYCDDEIQDLQQVKEVLTNRLK